MSSTDLTWPPLVNIKKHPRARHVKLKASLKHGLELVVPKRFNAKLVPSILEENRAWIEKQLAKIRHTADSQDVLPDEISLPGINLQFQIEYIPSPSKLKLIARPHQQFAIIGNLVDKNDCRKLLITALKKIAKIHLIKKLVEISQKTKLDFASATIRDQNSRWGSCSEDKKLNLSYKLIFLPEKLLEHVIIHELCHTIHLDHSDKFWKLVEKFDPEWQHHKKLLKNGEKFIPAWLMLM